MEETLNVEEHSSTLDCTNDDLKQVGDVISKVASLKPSMPSVGVYSVINAFNGLSCAQINQPSTLLACGFEDSIIKLWKLTEARLHSSIKEADELKRGKRVFICLSPRRLVHFTQMRIKGYGAKKLGLGPSKIQGVSLR